MKPRTTRLGLIFITIMMCCHMAQASIVIGSVNQTQEICNLSNGTLTINATGGNGTLYYSIDGGITFQESNYFENLESDDYYIIVSDGTVCSQDYTAQVTSAALPIISVSTDCIEGTGLTNIDLVPFPTGIPPYSFDWVGPAGTYNTEDLTGVPAGSYSVLVSDSFGCEVDTSFVIEECCGFELECNVDSSYLDCILEYNSYTTASFANLSNIEKINRLDDLYDIDVLGLPCDDLNITVSNVEEVGTDCTIPMKVTTTVTVADNLASHQCIKTYFIENYIEIGVIKPAENMVVSCDADVDGLLQQYLASYGGAEFTSCSAQSTITTNPAVPVLEYTSCSGSASVDVVFIVTDDCGQVDSTSAVFIVEDNVDPTILVCPSDVTIDPQGNIDEGIVEWMDVLSGEDNCSAVVYTNDLDFNNLASNCDGNSLEVGFFVTDDCGNSTSCQASLLIPTVEKPSINCPDNITVECGSDINAEVNPWLESAEGFDFDNSPLVVTNDFDPSTLSSIECSAEVTVNFTASNICEDAICSATVNVVDTTSPLIECPEALSVAYDAADVNQRISDWLQEVTSSDDCGQVEVMSDYFPEQLVLDCQGSELTVMFSASDDCSNTVDCQSTINVTGGQGGEIVCPTDLIINCDESDIESVIESWSLEVTASDGSGSQIPVTNNLDANVELVPCGDGVEIAFNATASCLDLECVAIIMIEDTESPKISCPDEMTLDFTASTFQDNFDAWIASVDGEDNCSEVKFGNDFDAQLDVACGESEDVVVIYTATDNCDNETSCETTVTLTAPAALPSIDCPGPLVLDCTEDIDLVNDWLISGSGLNGQGGTLDLENNFDSSLLSALSCGEEIDVTFVATDICGTVDCKAVISFIDVESPTITCPSELVISTSNSSPEAEVLSWLEDYQVTDNCQLSEVLNNFDQSLLSNLCDVTDPIEIEFVVSDLCDNKESCSALLSVSSGTISMTCPPDLALECSDEGFDTSIANWLAAGQAETSDGVELVVINDFNNDLAMSCDEEVVVLFQSADNCGEANSCEARIMIVDTEVPTIVCPSELNIAEYINLESQVQSWVAEVSGEDNCSDVSFTNDFDTELNDLNCPINLEVQFDAVDACQNVTSCRSRLVIGTENVLEITCPENFELGCSELAPDSLIYALLDEVVIESSASYEMDYTYSIDIYDIGCDYIYEFEAQINIYGHCDQEVECRVNIGVEPEHMIYVPNVFTPNERTENHFTVYANPVIEEVEEFYIYNKWGEKIFEAFNFEPNDVSVGWDGSYKNETKDYSNVYAYYAVLRSVTGEKVTAKGDVTLLK